MRTIYLHFIINFVYPFSEKDTPTMKELVKVMKLSGVRKNWIYLSQSLYPKGKTYVKDTIEADNKGDLKKCCYEMFEKWLEMHKNQGEATWKHLIDALRDNDLQSAADEIEESLKQGTSV